MKASKDDGADTPVKSSPRRLVYNSAYHRTETMLKRLAAGGTVDRDVCKEAAHAAVKKIMDGRA